MDYRTASSAAVHTSALQLRTRFIDHRLNSGYKRSALHSIWLDDDDTIQACLTSNRLTYRIRHAPRHRIFRSHAPLVIIMASRHAPAHERQRLILAYYARINTRGNHSKQSRLSRHPYTW
ncbi:hypothetical protein CY34DRAFT_454140 [Suillus luteus UH-Slu-Lm8-n1]|uniref:Uncharacterized protein n=1 Tax=Suillus luteus UH-Slu-Lm8-n1 TaxID=930992 RepID=A0A0C9ZJA9_9AGAM|nr:hypothetical protein CY34DRAFT_454140 [Suillus luteus UH-Slu-Lm8-n1]